MDCPVCGVTNEAGAAFCYHCGSALRPPDVAAQAATGQTVDLNRNAQQTASEAVPTPAREDRFADPAPESLHPAESIGQAASGPARVYEVPSRDVMQPYVVTPSAAMAQTSTLAVFALILGILSFIILPLIGGIGAVITGHMGRREIRASDGRITGEGLALAGLILGYVNIVLILPVCCVLLFVFGSIGS